MVERVIDVVHRFGKFAAMPLHVVDTARVTTGMRIAVRTGEGPEDVVAGIVIAKHHLRGEITISVDGQPQRHRSSRITFISRLS